MLGKFKKLKNRSLAEFKERGMQAGNILAEKCGLSQQINLLTDSQLFEKFDLTANKTISPENLLEHFRARKNVKFYASFDNDQMTIAELRRRFPTEETVIINRANRICEGFFDLLGYENLHFREKIPNWHFDPISSKTSPKIHWSRIEEVNAELTGDKKIIWELNRHQYFTTLGRAYLLTENEKYVQTWISHLENWFAENPPKIGVNWLSSLELAFRSISWIWAFYFFKNSPSFKSETLMQMLKYLHLHGRHLETYLSTYFSPNTHLTGEALGLYFLGIFLPEFEEARRWKKVGYEILLKALDFQVRSDGVYCEQASHYHRYTTDFYANLLILRQLEDAPIEPKHQVKLNQLFEFLLFITSPNGETSPFGDDDGGRFLFLDEKPITDFRSTLALGATIFNRSDLKFVAKEPSPELLWLLGPEGLQKFDELEAREPTQTSKAFEASGFFALRDSWHSDANFLLIDCGIHGFLNGGHAHADELSFVLSWKGKQIFIDSGTYNYTSDLKARNAYRSTAAHNCLTVNHESSSIPGGAFSWKSIANVKLLEWREEANSIYFRGTHNGFARFNLDYEREILFRKHDSIILTDNLTSDGENLFELNFILSPEVDAETENNRVIIFNKENRKEILLNIKTEIVAENESNIGFWKIENCDVSMRYGAIMESKKLIYTVTSKGKFKICNVFEKTFC